MPRPSSNWGFILPFVLIVVVLFGAAAMIWHAEEFSLPFMNRKLFADVGEGTPSFFAREYPANERFQQELDLLAATGKLQPDNRRLIENAILSSSQPLRMPPALLWCLLFQESRFNHLEGISGDSGARGLGQFSYFSFYEINHHLDRFTDDNMHAWRRVLGQDVRPIDARQNDLQSPSSYYFIPTAVVASAAFLNNRFHQLKRVLENRRIAYTPELLWLFSAMAYNKGGRSVIALWNDARRRGGNRRFEKTVTEASTLFEAMEDTRLLERSLRKIWPDHAAAEYAQEWKTHWRSLKSCALTPIEPAKKETD